MNCFVIGNGGWGTALGMVLAGNGHKVTIWGPFAEEINTIREAGENTVYLPSVKLPAGINWTADETEAEKADGIQRETHSAPALGHRRLCGNGRSPNNIGGASGLSCCDVAAARTAEPLKSNIFPWFCPQTVGP